MAGDAPSPGQTPDPADVPRSGLPAAPLALYRRYRPASFAEVKGQDQVTEPLRQALRSGRVHHAYLFSGPRGCGKTSSARILARSLNCEQGPTPDPCGKCASCIALAPAGPGSIDVIEIDAASHGGVDDARDLRERAFYAPVSGRFKIYIIDEAHMVTREGFNALLKLVEEPPPHLKFVFATTEPEKVIATIRSRTHHYPFRLVPPAVLREHLEQILDSEGVPYEPAVLPVVIRAGAGSVRDALSVLDQLIAGSDEGGLRYDRAISLLGYTDDRLLDEVIEAFSAGDGAAVFRAIDHVVEAGHDPRRFAADLLDRLRDLIILLAVPDAGSTGLIEAPADRLEQMQIQAGKFGPAELTRAAEVISAGLVEMRGATSPRLLLELMCSQVLLPPASAGNGALADRLDRLERRISAGPAPATASPPAASPPEPAQPQATSPAPRARPERRPAGSPGRDDQPAVAGAAPADAPAPRAPAAARRETSAPPAASAPQAASPASRRPGRAAGGPGAGHQHAARALAGSARGRPARTPRRLDTAQQRHGAVVRGRRAHPGLQRGRRGQGLPDRRIRQGPDQGAVGVVRHHPPHRDDGGANTFGRGNDGSAGGSGPGRGVSSRAGTRRLPVSVARARAAGPADSPASRPGRWHGSWRRGRTRRADRNGPDRAGARRPGHRGNRGALAGRPAAAGLRVCP